MRPRRRSHGRRARSPLFDRDDYLARPFIRSLPAEIRDVIAAHGIRNALVTSIAPTGTISLFAGNVSSGIEPVFAYAYTRRVLQPDGTRTDEEVEDCAYRAFRARFGDATLPDYFVNVRTLTPADHLSIQAAAQKYIDSSISKTINVPADMSFDTFKDVYAQAYVLGCKGCTTYRPNAVTGSVLEAPPGAAPSQLPIDRADEPLLPFSLPEQRGGGVVYMTRPLDRPDVLLGQTYKIKWLDSDHAFYITVNDIEKDGRRRPFEVFINSKNMEAYAWTLALTRMISAGVPAWWRRVVRGRRDEGGVRSARRAMDGRALCALVARRHRRDDRAASGLDRLHGAARRDFAKGGAPRRRAGRGRRARPVLPPMRQPQLRAARRLRQLHLLRLLEMRVVQGRMNYSSRFFLYAPLALLLAIGAAVGVHWWLLADALGKRLDAVSAHPAMPGVTVRYASRTVGGFPFRIDVVFQDFRVEVATPARTGALAGRAFCAARTHLWP